MHADIEVCGLAPESDYVELAVEVFTMLADASRVRIILALRNADELPVNRLAELIDKSPAATSQHLAKLRLARMVTYRKDGTTAYYRLADEHASQLVIDAVKQAEHTFGQGQANPPHHHASQEHA